MRKKIVKNIESSFQLFLTKNDELTSGLHINLPCRFLCQFKLISNCHHSALFMCMQKNG